MCSMHHELGRRCFLQGHSSSSKQQQELLHLHESWNRHRCQCTAATHIGRVTPGGVVVKPHRDQETDSRGLLEYCCADRLMGTHVRALRCVPLTWSRERWLPGCLAAWLPGCLPWPGSAWKGKEAVHQSLLATTNTWQHQQHAPPPPTNNNTTRLLDQDRQQYTVLPSHDRYRALVRPAQGWSEWQIFTHSRTAVQPPAG